ncbi:hypothetical protein [Caballeronia cordobensis]|uniref:hypothetical protein n=1 Tax=Caballeronia cordobensis TaxID=1353886 RepID=UPI00045EF72C|nr:hypothetical protein BRPE67_ACDS09490 [Burkholderia sp. RPE67]
MSYLRDWGLQRRYLSSLAKQLDLPLTRHNGKRRVPLGNDEVRVAIHDTCLGPKWGDCTDGKNAAQMDMGLGRMVDTMQMRNGFNLAAAQALIKAGKWAKEGASAAHANGRPHAYVMSRLQAASEYYALAREYQAKHEAARAV